MSGCRVCGCKNLERLISFPKYPIFIGCTDAAPDADELYDFEVYLCGECGFIQQVALPPLEVLYRENRAFGIGGIWKQHYEEFIKFIVENGKLSEIEDVLEIGGGNGVVLKRLREYANLTLTDIEPSPQYGELSGVTTIRKYFDQSFEGKERYDLIYCSHLIEHVTDPKGFIASCSRLLRPGGALITACPNISKSFEQNHLNAFTTDHLNYFTPERIEGLAAEQGLVREAFYQYRDHGMYNLFRKRHEAKRESKPAEVHALRSSFQRYWRTISAFASTVRPDPERGLYLFGAHAFTITFLRLLSGTTGIRAVLDNEPTKQNRRLSGTSLICKSPSVLKEEANPTVVIYMGAYTEEICAQLKVLQPNATLIRLDQFARA
jgi:SAM-dependent methyltransferase